MRGTDLISRTDAFATIRSGFESLSSSEDFKHLRGACASDAPSVVDVLRE
jgi:hypothetical protein